MYPSLPSPNEAYTPSTTDIQLLPMIGVQFDHIHGEYHLDGRYPYFRPRSSVTLPSQVLDPLHSSAPIPEGKGLTESMDWSLTSPQEIITLLKDIYRSFIPTRWEGRFHINAMHIITENKENGALPRRKSGSLSSQGIFSGVPSHKIMIGEGSTSFIGHSTSTTTSSNVGNLPAADPTASIPYLSHSSIYTFLHLKQIPTWTPSSHVYVVSLIPPSSSTSDWDAYITEISLSERLISSNQLQHPSLVTSPFMDIHCNWVDPIQYACLPTGIYQPHQSLKDEIQFNMSFGSIFLCPNELLTFYTTLHKLLIHPHSPIPTSSEEISPPLTRDVPFEGPLLLSEALDQGSIQKSDSSFLIASSTLDMMKRSLSIHIHFELCTIGVGIVSKSLVSTLDTNECGFYPSDDMSSSATTSPIRTNTPRPTNHPVTMIMWCFIVQSGSFYVGYDQTRYTIAVHSSLIRLCGRPSSPQQSYAHCLSELYRYVMMSHRSSQYEQPDVVTSADGPSLQRLNADEQHKEAPMLIDDIGCNDISFHLKRFNCETIFKNTHEIIVFRFEMSQLYLVYDPISWGDDHLNVFVSYVFYCNQLSCMLLRESVLNDDLSYEFDLLLDNMWIKSKEGPWISGEENSKNLLTDVMIFPKFQLAGNLRCV